MSKLVVADGMIHKVYTKLYTSALEPILMYGSGVWGTKQLSCISSVQNRTCKFFLSTGKLTSNISTRGNMGWTSAAMKRHVNYCVVLCRLVQSDDKRKCQKIWWCASWRRKGWTFEVEKTLEQLNIRDMVYDETISTKGVMRSVTEKLIELDNSNGMRNYLTIEVT